MLFPVDLDGNVFTHPGDQFVEAHLNGLSELIGNPWYLAQHLLHLQEHLLPAIGRGPFRTGFHFQDDIAYFNGHGVRGDLGRSDLAQGDLHLGKVVQQRLLDLLRNLDALLKRTARRQDLVQSKIAFLQGGNEFATQSIEKP